MICIHKLSILTKRKETVYYCELFGYGGKSALTNISNDLTYISVPVEER
jgi:hypothetical protein